MEWYVRNTTNQPQFPTKPHKNTNISGFSFIKDNKIVVCVVSYRQKD